MPPALMAATPVGAVTGAFLLDSVQEGRFACAGLAREKDILIRVAEVFECVLELGIGYEAHT
jgi:hypothetical protein